MLVESVLLEIHKDYIEARIRECMIVIQQQSLLSSCHAAKHVVPKHVVTLYIA